MPDSRSARPARTIRRGSLPVFGSDPVVVVADVEPADVPVVPDEPLRPRFGSCVRPLVDDAPLLDPLPDCAVLEPLPLNGSWYCSSPAPDAPWPNASAGRAENGGRQENRDAPGTW